MKKFVPFIFPLIALVIVIFLAYRWYSMNTPANKGEISDFGEGVTIENLSEDTQAAIIKGSPDLKTAALSGEGEVNGEVRYEIKDGKVRFTVMAELPKSGTGGYQVWLNKVGGSQRQKAFELVPGKGGYIGSAAIDEALLPFEVNVTKPGATSAAPGETVLKGVINK